MRGVSGFAHTAAISVDRSRPDARTMPTAPRPGAVAMATIGSVRCARSVAAFIMVDCRQMKDAAVGAGPNAASPCDGGAAGSLALDDLRVGGFQALALVALDATVD